MGIVVLGIDLGKNSCTRAGLSCGVGCGGVRWRALSEVLSAASWRWKFAAARIIWAACSPARDTLTEREDGTLVEADPRMQIRRSPSGSVLKSPPTKITQPPSSCSACPAWRLFGPAVSISPGRIVFDFTVLQNGHFAPDHHVTLVRFMTVLGDQLVCPSGMNRNDHRPRHLANHQSADPRTWC